ncbi:MAG: helix-turn-helix domain-containing protein [Chitinophagales bacterium]|jgi:transcriptional regulator with XRE-family HTH domain|nr:helix-turn-helix domain-containing protein [Sphingobacteriales bacterium]
MDLVLENIVKYRKEKGYSHEVMANLLEIAQPTYYKIESGKTELSLKRLYQIASALELGIEKLIGIEAKQMVHQVKDTGVGIQNIENQYNHMKESYEEHIKSLKEEINYLRTLVRGASDTVD